MQKGLLTLLAITLLAGTSLLNTTINNESNSFLEDEVMKVYQNWQKEHGKRYTQFENSHRFGIFKKNYEYIQEHQKRVDAGLETFEIGLNNFADLSVEEFEAKYLKYKSTPREQTKQVYKKQGKQVPVEVDLRKDGVVSDVKNQGSCGSCWAFSAVAALETALRQAGVKNVELSEQELVDCAVKDEFESEGCDGGEMYDGFAYASKYGIAIRSEYPYAGVDQQCAAKKTKTRYQFAGFVDVESLNPQAYVEAAAEHALSIGINASGINFQLYKKGIYNAKCDGSKPALNHGVTNVGYAPDYYLIKNSWGISWGESGYIRFARIQDKQGQCGAQQEVNYPLYTKFENQSAIFE
ncbi:unnamed protein product [Paramecium primaurelia]|uniref:Papain family cysteine protease n=1 Tax=Paramecium primaurelia TaxID=5886 RepID=A0A8S1LA25_PARPR|nr:unnamed protein product [Paramecium primaurelia]